MTSPVNISLQKSLLVCKLFRVGIFSINGADAVTFL